MADRRRFYPMNTELERLKGEIERLDALAAPAPWSNMAIGYEVDSRTGTVCQMMSETSHERDSNASFITYARTALPRLLSIALELEEENRKLRQEKYSLMEELHGLG